MTSSFWKQCRPRGLSYQSTEMHPTMRGHNCCDDMPSFLKLIEKCFFNTGDDCIALNSGRNVDARRVNVPCRNVIVRDCKMQGR